ncbi:hypothetical protein TrCOL_g3643 [Triparma columacea]|uniref:7-dehydrocholesterol reductase n=1 Tax=Triparma columacea TaxID=722753 RepID=A0A9W7LF80_9STRA|nr:hypothetical protein TrCOL_g3643 [Triparma columacea]
MTRSRSVEKRGATRVNFKEEAKQDWESGVGFLPGRETLGPLILMTFTPPFVLILQHITLHFSGSLTLFLRHVSSIFFSSSLSSSSYVAILSAALSSTLSAIPTPFSPSALRMILSFTAFQLILTRFIPGPPSHGPVTPQGNTPVYKANGMSCYIITLLTALCLDSTGGFSLSRVHEEFGEILSSLNLLALLLCFYLYFKGRSSPTTTDSGTNGGAVLDFYWGLDLYPNILGWDVKLMTNCRLGMMFWAVGVISFARASMNATGSMPLAMFVNAALQIVYVTKFFHWEMGYMCSMDIQVDRAGYYLCWGCLVWVPCVYTSSSYYLSVHSPDLSPASALLIFLLGYASIYLNYDADYQRALFRRTGGECVINLKPPTFIRASYKTREGKTRENLLLTSGWWGVAKHVGYSFEILSSFFWSSPAGFNGNGMFVPYFYVIFLTILLVDRSFRDDDRCRKKYGKDWEKYEETVKYKIIPGLI